MLLNLPWMAIGIATWQTIYMVFLSGAFSIFIGLFVGIGLFLTQADGLYPKPFLHHTLAFFVNVGRSIPYIILMIAILPLTRLLIGTTIGINAAIVPLTLAAVPFYARLAENAFREVSTGCIEAGLAMGASRYQILRYIVLPESLASLVNSAGITLIGLIGYSAMAGTVGGGGLGALAIDYGYERFDAGVMLVTVIILIGLVQAVQMLMNRLSRVKRIKPLLILVLLLGGACLGSNAFSYQTSSIPTLRVGIMSGTEETVMAVAKKIAWQTYHFNLVLVPFDDYVLPNTALNNGDLDANIFQHLPYLQAQIKKQHYALIPIAKTFIYPMGFYSVHYKTLSALPSHAIIAIPNDPSNEARALLLLQKAHIITLKPNANTNATLQDVSQNPYDDKLIEVDAAGIPRMLPDVAMGALTNDYVGPAGFTVNQALIKEDQDSLYANIIVVRTSTRHNPLFTSLIAIMHSKPVIEATMKVFPHGAAIVAGGGV